MSPKHRLDPVVDVRTYVVTFKVNHAEYPGQIAFDSKVLVWTDSSKVNLTLRTTKDAACHDYVNNQND